MDKNKVIPLVVVVIAALAIVGYFMFRGGNVTPPVANAESVATVNGVAIPKSAYDSQLASAISSYQTQGVDVTNTEKLAEIKTQVLDDLINNELVNQGVVSAGIKASQADVDKQVQDITTQLGGADKFQAELVKANITEAQLRENISKQLAVQAYLAANVDTNGITVSDAEVSQFYSDYSKAQTTASSTIKVPALKDLSEQIKQQITANKQQELVNAFLATLRSKAQITKSI